MMKTVLNSMGSYIQHNMIPNFDNQNTDTLKDFYTLGLKIVDDITKIKISNLHTLPTVLSQSIMTYLSSKDVTSTIITKDLQKDINNDIVWKNQYSKQWLYEVSDNIFPCSSNKTCSQITWKKKYQLRDAIDKNIHDKKFSDNVIYSVSTDVDINMNMFIHDRFICIASDRLIFTSLASNDIYMENTKKE